MIPTPRNLQRLLLPVCVFILFCTFISLFRDHPIVTTATQKASEWALGSETGTAVDPAPPVSTHVTELLLEENDNPEGRLAPSLNASELMERPIATRLGTIPRIFHQSWIDSNLPAKFQAWSEGCRKKHYDYEHVLWTNDDNLKLVKKHFPWLLEAYNALPGDIYRADLARNLYMYIFGGVYADLDTDCLRSCNVIFRNLSVPHVAATKIYDDADSSVNRTAFFGRMGTDRSFAHSIPNAWMASTPGHPFFLLPLLSVIERLGNENEMNQLPETVTGPVALRNAILEYSRKYAYRNHPEALDNHLKERIESGPFEPMTGKVSHTVVVLHQDVIYPYSWYVDGQPYAEWCWVLNDGYDAEKCKEAVNVKGKGSVSITYWSHTHSPTGHNDEAFGHISKKVRKARFSD